MIDQPKKLESDTMPDVMREQLIRLIYEKAELAEIYDECTEDEFVARVFKGYDDDFGIESRRFSYVFFSIWWGLLEPLTDFCKKNNLEMHVHGSKAYEKAYLEIYMKDGI